jgi:hypothetical protein
MSQAQTLLNHNRSQSKVPSLYNRILILVLFPCGRRGNRRLRTRIGHHASPIHYVCLRLTSTSGYPRFRSVPDKLVVAQVSATLAVRGGCLARVTRGAHWLVVRGLLVLLEEARQTSGISSYAGHGDRDTTAAGWGGGGRRVLRGGTGLTSCSFIYIPDKHIKDSRHRLSKRLAGSG